MKAIPASSFSESFLVALVWDMAWEISNVAVRFQIRFSVFLFQEPGPFLMRRISNLPSNGSGTKDGTILGYLCSR